MRSLKESDSEAENKTALEELDGGEMGSCLVGIKVPLCRVTPSRGLLYSQQHCIAHVTVSPAFLRTVFTGCSILGWHLFSF